MNVLLRACCVVWWGWAASGAVAATLPQVPEPRLPEAAAIERRLDAIESWLTAPANVSGPSIPVGLTRGRAQRRDEAGQPVPIAEDARFQLTAACTSLRFLVARAAQSGLSTQRRTHIEAFRDAIGAARSADAGALQRGALANEMPARQYVSFANAICGDALLDVHLLLHDEASLDLALGIGDYFIRLDAAATGLLVPALDARGAELPWGMPDRVTASGVIQVTYTTWNLAAAPFLSRLARVAGAGRFEPLAQRVARFHLEGLEGGHDYFAARPRSRSRGLSTVWNLGYARAGSELRHDFRDGRWHRQGDIRVPPTGTVGTDQIEYGLEALERLGGRQAQVQALYHRYRDLPAATACIDPGLSFSGYFRLDDGEPARSVSYGSYYDIVGAGILAPLKRRVAPRDHANAISAIVANEGDWAMLDCALAPIWSERNDAPLARRSVLVAAQGGLALVDALLNRR